MIMRVQGGVTWMPHISFVRGTQPPKDKVDRQMMINGPRFISALTQMFELKRDFAAWLRAEV